MLPPEHIALLKRFLGIIFLAVAWLLAWTLVLVMPLGEYRNIAYLVLLGAMLLEALLRIRRRRLEDA